MTAPERELFEAWLREPPYERAPAQFESMSPRAGQYKDYLVHLAWEAWQEARRVTSREDELRAENEKLRAVADAVLKFVRTIPPEQGFGLLRNAAAGELDDALRAAGYEV